MTTESIVKLMTIIHELQKLIYEDKAFEDNEEMEIRLKAAVADLLWAKHELP